MALNVAKTAVALAAIHRTERDMPLELDGTQFEAVVKDARQHKVIVAGAQTGKTTVALLVLFAMAELSLRVGFIMPQDSDRTRLVNDKVLLTVNNTPHYREGFDSSSIDSVRMKRYREAMLFFLSSESKTDFLSFSADAMMQDEYDWCNLDNTVNARSRMNRSAFRFTWHSSTPTLPGDPPDRPGEKADNIMTLWLEGDQQRYMTTCQCGCIQWLDWWKNVVEETRDQNGMVIGAKVRDPEWGPGAPFDIRPLCVRCGKPMDRLANGRWVAGKPGNPIGSWHINRLASPHGDPLSALFATYQKAIGNMSKMQAFANMHLGVDFNSTGSAFTREMLSAWAMPYKMTPASGEVGVMGIRTFGVDVNSPYFSVHISEWTRSPQGMWFQRKLFCGEIVGQQKLIDTLVAFKVRGGVIDNQPELNLVLGLQATLARMGIRLIRCQYATHPMTGDITVSTAGETDFLPPILITADRTATIDDLHSACSRGMVRWPQDWSTVHGGVVYQQMTRARRIAMKNDSGQTRWAWDGKPDHQMHACNYDWIAGRYFTPPQEYAAASIIVDRAEQPERVVDISKKLYEDLIRSAGYEKKKPNDHPPVMILRG